MPDTTVLCRRPYRLTALDPKRSFDSLGQGLLNNGVVRLIVALLSASARFRALGLIRTFSGNGGPCSCWPQKIRPTPVPYPRSSFRPFWGAAGSARFGRQSTCRLPPSTRPVSYSRYCG